MQVKLRSAALFVVLFPNEGKILFDDDDLSQYSIKQISEKIGYVMQDPNQMISQKMIFDEVALGLRLRGYSK